MSKGIVRVEDVIRYIADQYTKHKRLVPYWLSVGDVPRTDAVEVVMCKDCKHRHDGCCEEIPYYWDDDDFCSYGVRREEDE